MKQMGYVVAAVLVLAGAVFLLQGLRVLPSQLMYGKPEWVVIGAILVVAGAAMAVVVNRREARR